MKLLDETEAGRYTVNAVYREAPMAHLGWPLFLLISGAGLLWGIVSGVVHPVLIWIALFCFLFFMFTSYSVYPVLRSTNWLVKRTDDGVLIKFRSYLNAHLEAEGPTVVYLPAAEIAAVRVVHEKRINHLAQNQRQMSKYVHIDFVLNHAGTAALKAALQAERQYQPPASYVHRGKIPAYPVSVPEPGIVRVTWKGHETAITPDAARAAAQFGARYPVADNLEFVHDYANRERHQELEALLWEYCRRGRVSQAVRVARERYGYTIGEATMYVEEVLREVRAENTKK